MKFLTKRQQKRLRNAMLVKEFGVGLAADKRHHHTLAPLYRATELAPLIGWRCTAEDCDELFTVQQVPSDPLTDKSGPRLPSTTVLRRFNWSHHMRKEAADV